jgi:DNA uptake protein ComE-like DNA-binding protein
VHHRAERNGAIALLVIMTLIWLGIELAFHFKSPPKLEGSEFTIYTSLHKEGADTKEPTPAVLKDNLFKFNPNTLTDQGWDSLGFSEKDISTLRKYQAAGGNFKIKSDVSKLFFVSDENYQLLEPFIDLPEKRPQDYQDTIRSHNRKGNKVSWSDTANTSYYRYTSIICDLNLADTNELKQLPYIGSFYAAKIVEYREQLGGYSTLAQLLELWKMTPETIDKFADRVSIDQTQIRKLNVNELTGQELSVHPYISSHLASQIVLMRESQGAFPAVQDNCLNGLLNAELCSKLAPYLVYE